MIRCPHCWKSIGGAAAGGGLRVRLGIVLLDPETGAVSGPCPRCKATIQVSDGGTLAKAMQPTTLVPAFRVSKG